MEISEEKREEIRKQAKDILNNFAKALEKVKLKEKEEMKKVGGFREEKEGMKGDEDFIDRMFKNAPRKEDGYIIAEKKKW